MPVQFDQLIYTSFAGVGFRVLASIGIPIKIQQAFIQQVVYQRWNSYKPLKAGYRAAYIHQVTLEHNLFGWLYNDGVDDLGRAQVPYFVCYYYSEALHTVQLENIFNCLHKGPVSFIERQNLPATLETIILPDLCSYQTAQIGVEIPFSVRQSSYIALQQRRLLDLFISADEPETVIQVNEQSKKQLSASVQQPIITIPIPLASPERQENIPVFPSSSSESQIDSFTSETKHPASPNKSTLLIGVGVGFASSLALIGTIIGFLQWQYWQDSHLVKPPRSVISEFSKLKKECCQLKINSDFFLRNQEEIN